MVPPKPAKAAPKPAKSAAKPAKSAAKPAGSAPPQESIFAAMKKQGALAKNMAKAKKVVAVREFDGPDGDYLANLNRVSHYTKDGALGIVLEFRATEEGETQGQKMVVFFSFKNTDRETVQEVQNRFFETLQLMGIETDCDDEQLDVALKNLISTKAELTMRVKTGNKGGKFISVVGLASAAKEVDATDYVEESPLPDDEMVAAKEEALDEWNEEVPAEELVEEIVDEVVDDSKPSAWVGYAMMYKGKEVEVTDADDEGMKCVIKDGTTGKKYKVPFAQLSPPAA